MKEKKTRNILVAVGASIGIMSIMLMLSIGNGIKTYIRDTMESLANPLAVEVTMPEEKILRPWDRKHFYPTPILHKKILTS